MAGHACGRGGVEEVAVVLKRGNETAVDLSEGEGQVELRDALLDR